MALITRDPLAIMHHTKDKTKTPIVPVQQATPLPLRADAPDLPDCDPPQKEMSKTAGGKATDFFIYRVLGAGANSSLSVFVTYYLNPKPWVKNVRKGATDGVKKIFGQGKIGNAVENAVEIGFMLIAGTILTACMAPLVTRREKIAHWVNKKLGKDTDVLPEDMRKHGTPLTLDDRIAQELKKRVNYGQTSGDLWKARWTSIIVPLVGDTYLGKVSAQREEAGKWSVDTFSWKIGQHLYDEVLHKDTVAKLGNFFTTHEAGIEHMQKNNKKTYDRLKVVEDRHERIRTEIDNKPKLPSPMRNDRMMIADQTRLLGKEVGWTIITSDIMERLTRKFQDRRIRKQETKAIAKMREEGIIPVGIHVVTDKEGHVKLTKTKHYVPPALPDEHGIGEVIADAAATHTWATNKVKQVTATPEKATSHLEAVHTSKLRNETAPSLG